jgi:drug/metabolite transporter (DMT)-like permease
MDTRQKWLVPLCLLALYFIWGSTFLGMKLAIESFPPFMMASLRFLLAGGLLYAVLRLMGTAGPSLAQWGGAAVVGTLLLSVGNAGVAYAQQWVDTGAAAMVIATVPIWVAMFSGFWGEWPHRREWLGIALGLLGVAILNLDGNMRASSLGAMVLLVAAASWAFGSVLGKRLPLPAGAMSSAAQMLAGGAVLAIVSWQQGESMTAAPTANALLALAYLVVFGSFIAYSAYLYLLKTVRPALATSYAFVNPLVAIALGVWLANERIGMYEVIAMAVILAGVLLVLWPGFRVRTSFSDNARR